MAGEKRNADTLFIGEFRWIQLHQSDQQSDRTGGFLEGGLSQPSESLEKTEGGRSGSGRQDVCAELFPPVSSGLSLEVKDESAG